MPNPGAEPRLVIPNASRRWLTTVNYDLFVYDDRLVAVQGLTIRSGIAQAKAERQEREALGVPARGSVWGRQRARTEERVAAAIANAGPADAESSDRIVVMFADVSRARLGKRAGIVTLRLQLRSGTRHTWRWMSNSLAKPYADVAPVLRDVLGDLL